MKSTHFRMREPDRAGAGCGAGNSRRAAFGLLLLLALAVLFIPLSAEASEYEPGPYFRLRAGVDFSAGEGTRMRSNEDPAQLEIISINKRIKF